jgi:hypothetical protein
LPSLQQWEAICSGLAASTTLTKLQLHILGCSAAEQEQELEPDIVQLQDEELEPPVQVCDSLLHLTDLKDLSITSSCLVPGDALALTALTGLTRLVLSDASAGVGDLAATAIASSCGTWI